MNTRPLQILPLVFLLGTASAWAQSPQQPANRESLALPSLAPLVESVKAAVVNVDVQLRGGREEALERFFGPRGRGGVRQGAGSGFVIDPKGVVITNNHVVDGDLAALRVRLSDGRAFDAQVLGRDPLTDVALLQLKGKIENLPTVRLGDSSAMRVGDWAVAIGNPFGLSSSVTLGIISATARDIHAGPYDEFLQTDAAINPGNSGGPLFNMRGEVIGMNTAIFGAGTNTGIGFAVPSNLIKALLPQLQNDGSVTRAWLGIGIQDLGADLARALNVPVPDGALVTQVNDGSPAKKAGLQVDDVITAVDGEKIGSGGQLTRTIALKKPGSVSTLTVFRQGKQNAVKVSLGTRPDIDGVGRQQRPQRSKDDERQERIGLVFQDMNARLAQSTGLPTQGALISEVLPGTPADRAELRPGMVVIEASGKRVRGASDLVAAIRAAPSGAVLLLRVETQGGGRALRALNIP